jgi:hypothetical protein
LRVTKSTIGVCFSRKECEAIAAHLLKFWFSVAAEIITLV